MQELYSPQKVIDLYRYIKEVALLKRQIVTDISAQPWFRYLKDIHGDAENIGVQYRDRLVIETDSDVDGIAETSTEAAMIHTSGTKSLPTLFEGMEVYPLLTVHRPAFTRCPEPPAMLLPWLEPDWGHFNSVLRIIEKHTETDDSGNILFEESFSDSGDRMKALALWQPLRDTWAEKQKIVEKTRSLFQKLYEVHTDLARDSETLELLVGNGVVKQVGNDAVLHPALIKRVKTVFDALSNTIHIVDRSLNWRRLCSTR